MGSALSARGIQSGEDGRPAPGDLSPSPLAGTGGGTSASVPAGPALVGRISSAAVRRGRLRVGWERPRLVPGGPRGSSVLALAPLLRRFPRGRA